MRRVRRLVSVGASVLQRPAGCVWQAMERACEREGTFRLLEKGSVDARSVSQAAAQACAQRLEGQPYSLVPVDGSSLNFKDALHLRGTGPIGARSRKGRGFQVQTALGLDAQGMPCGLWGQAFWARAEKRSDAPSRKRRLHRRETQHVLDVLYQAQQARNAHSPGLRLWFQLDRGNDFKEALAWATQHASQDWVTVRAGQNRRCLSAQGDGYLFDTVERAPSIGTLHVHLPSTLRPNRKRLAKLTLRTQALLVPLKDRWRKQLWGVAGVTAVLACEEGPLPRGETPQQWLLLTTRPVRNEEDARHVVRAYALRWRVEDFHKAWKNSCRVEDSQLRTASALCTWAAILACVATRIENLKHLARTQPDPPAREHFSEEELDALFTLYVDRHPFQRASCTVRQVCILLARFGGWDGSVNTYDKKPPGTVTLGRGLEYIQPAVRLLQIQRRLKK